jgi:methionine-rich copper-binding protein CopC
MKAFIVRVLAAASLAAPAMAHTHLSSTVPADGSTVAAAPAEFVLNFSEPARLTALSVQMEGGVAQKITALPPSATAAARVAAPKLQNGRYTLTYRVVGADGHVMNGKVQFTIGGKPSLGAASPSADHGAHAGH